MREFPRRVPAPQQLARAMRRTAVPAAAALGLWLGSRGPVVGRFRSAAAKAAYLRAYDRAMADLPEPDRTLDIPTRFGTVRGYRFDGPRDDEPLVLLQGQSSAAPAWGDTLPELLRRRTVYALDLLGQAGRSTQDTPLVSFADHAAWLRDVLDALPEERFHLVGLSIGGWNAMNLAARDPAGIASLTLLDSPLVVGPLSTETILRSIPMMLPGVPRSWLEGFTRWTAGGAPTDDLPVADLIATGLETYTGASTPPGLLTDEDLTAIEAPVLYIVAGASTMHDPQVIAERARRRLRRGTVRVYDGASHAVFYERTAQVLDDLEAFLRSGDLAEGESLP
jgi:pimeloyl-ACP methyl ester carboxylesterase